MQREGQDEDHESRDLWFNAVARVSVIALLIVCSGFSAGAGTASSSPDRVRRNFTGAEGAGTPGSPAGDGWTIVPSPNTGSPNNYFFGIAAVASDNAWAVGSYGVQGNQAWQIIQHWDGLQWTPVTTPSLAIPNELLAISAAATDNVWAVGGYNSGGQSLIQHWNGTAWQVVQNPNPGTFNRFFGVAAISDNDVWAAGVTNSGGLSETFVEHWDGTSWQISPTPNVPDAHNQLNAVTAVPGSPNQLWAVGEAGPSALILHWNGIEWNIVPSPDAGNLSRLSSVVAISPNDVWAVGWTDGGSGPVTLTEHWDGSTWSVVPSPNPGSTFNQLWGVTAVAANNVWAVGEFNAKGGNQQTLILQWNGTGWLQVPGDNTGPNGVQFFLRAVGAAGASDIWAVGNNSHTLAEHWNGSSWSIVSTPNAGVGDNIVNAVSGSSSTDVWEVGHYAFGTWKQTLIEHWNGTQWDIVPSPNANNRLNELSGVVAISPSNAWAVGNTSSGNALDQITLILHWDGKAWNIVPSPSPGTAGLNTLYAVAANAANDAWAVGSFTNNGEFAQTLTMHWDGTSWTVVPSANVLDSNNELYSVVALGPDDVWAVGYWGNAASGFSTLIEHWNGSTWSLVSSPNPSGDNFLSAVSATGANDIWAVGRSRNPSTFQTRALIVHWDGNIWSEIMTFGVQPDSAAYGVAAVSPDDAWAVGDGAGLTLIGRWTGSSWSVFSSPKVAGRLLATTAITPCDVWAVGQRYVENVGFLTLNQHFVSNGCAEPSPTPTPTPTAAPTSSPTPTPAPTPVATLGNISTRLRVEEGDNALIGGFIVTGTQPKRVIVRAIGPSLPISGALADPILELRDSAGTLIRSNDNWRMGGQEAEIIATGIPPNNDLDSAIVATLPANNSVYTAIVRGMANGTGIGLVEVYDLDPMASSKLANISTRGLVQIDENVMIAGTVVIGPGSLRVLVRAIGPSLPVKGVLGDPTLELRDANGVLIRANDNWRTGGQEDEINATGIPPPSDMESALIETLPGNNTAYTAIVRGINNTTGIALIEVYGLN